MKHIQNKIKDLNKRRGSKPDSSMQSLREICEQVSEAKEQLMLVIANKNSTEMELEQKASQLVLYSMQFYEALGLNASNAMKHYFEFIETRFKDYPENDFGIQKNEFGEYFNTNDKNMVI